MISLLKALNMKDIPASVEPIVPDLEWYIGELVAAAFDLKSANAASKRADKAKIVNEVYHRMGWVMNDLRRDHG